MHTLISKRFILVFLYIVFSTSIYANEHIPCFINGNLYKSQGNYTKALEAYMSGVDKNVTNCMIEASMLYFNEEHNIPYRPKLAFELLQKALHIEPYNSLIHYNLSGYYYYLGNDTSKRETGDLKVKYHSTIAYILGDEDALYYVNGFRKLKKKNGYIEDVLNKNILDTELISTRLEKFSHGKITITGKQKDASVVLHTKYFTIVVKKEEIKFYGRLDMLSAKSFGKHIRTIQQALYIDIPTFVTSKTDDILSKFMLDSSGNFMLDEEFSDVLKHELSLVNSSKVFVYRISVVK